MKNTIELTSYNTYHTIDVIEPMQVKLNINYNPYHFALDDLFLMAARKNKKRSFLFVSKILGKHIPIAPDKGLAAGLLLAESYYHKVEGIELSTTSPFVEILKDNDIQWNKSPFIGNGYSPIIIGFAETATALGHAFFQAFTHADYFHTTREDLMNQESLINFEEEHSHATSHRCYVDEELLQNSREIILVDDEVTTGKTARNIITSLHEKFPRKNYTIVSLLDWRSDADKKASLALEKELNINIRHVSLLSGEVEVNREPVISSEEERIEPKFQWNQPTEIYIEKELPSVFDANYYPTNNQNPPFHKIPYLAESGRFGLNNKENDDLTMKAMTVAELLNERSRGKQILCIGTGEFMYLPMKIASMMNGNVMYQSTTRSPIHINNQSSYGARYGISFSNPEVEEIMNYVYNIPPDTYDEVFVFFERLVDKQLLHSFLQQLNIANIQVVYMKGVR